MTVSFIMSYVKFNLENNGMLNFFIATAFNIIASKVCAQLSEVKISDVMRLGMNGIITQESE